MLKLLILVVVICIIAAILKSVLSAVGEIILGIIGIALIIAAIVFLGPIILGLLPHLLKLIPWILLILAVLFVLGCIFALVEKRRYRSHMKRLDQLGIDQMDDATEDWKRMDDLGMVETTASGYVVSISFYKNVIKHIGQEPVLTMDEFKQHCAACASQFQVSLVTPFLEFLQKKKLLYQFHLSSGEVRILSKAMMKQCADLFLKEGAATEDQFARICENAGLFHEFPKDGQRLVCLYLDEMVSCGKFEKVQLNKAGVYLYKSKEQRPDSNLVRREISLD